MDKHQQPLVSIIVLNYNAKEFLINCIDSIFHSNYQNFEVILVDNNSNDNSFDICKKNHPEINLIVNQIWDTVVEIILASNKQKENSL